MDPADRNAENTCRRIGGIAAEIRTSDEYDLVHDLIKTKGNERNNALGGKYLEKGEYWVWPSDQMVFFKGNFDEPACGEESCLLAKKYFWNNTQNYYDDAVRNGMHCLAMGQTGRWQANDCDSGATVVCEAKVVHGKRFYFEKLKHKDEP